MSGCLPACMPVWIVLPKGQAQTFGRLARLYMPLTVLLGLGHIGRISCPAASVILSLCFDYQVQVSMTYQEATLAPALARSSKSNKTLTRTLKKYVRLLYPVVDLWLWRRENGSN